MIFILKVTTNKEERAMEMIYEFWAGDVLITLIRAKDRSQAIRKVEAEMFRGKYPPMVVTVIASNNYEIKTRQPTFNMHNGYLSRSRRTNKYVADLDLF